MAKRAGGGHEARPVAVVAEHAASEDLLDQDRDEQLAGGGGHREDDREQEALLQLGGDRQAPAQHGHRAGAPEGLLLVGLVGVAPLVVVAARAAPRR